MDPPIILLLMVYTMALFQDQNQEVVPDHTLLLHKLPPILVVMHLLCLSVLLFHICICLYIAVHYLQYILLSVSSHSVWFL
jgi:hypothetical protein